MYLRVVLQVLIMNKEVNPVELDFLLRFPTTPNVTSPVDFMNNNSWGGIKVSIFISVCMCAAAWS